MAQLRAVWPDVQRASQVGHTLRVIHRRLNQMGIPITYRRLTVYRGRLQREKTKTVTAPVSLAIEGEPASVSKVFDPLANWKAHEKKRVDWKYPSGPPDERKLI
jgi:hypothetical protein